MKKILLTRDAARRIAAAGTDYGLKDCEIRRRPPHAPAEREVWRCWFENDGGSVIRPGELVGVHAMSDADLSSDEAAANWAASGIRAKVKRVGRIDDGNAGRLMRGVALDEIAPGGRGRGEIPGAMMAWVWRDPNVFSEADRFYTRADWISAASGKTEVRRLAFVKYPGDYTVIDAARGDSGGNFFSLLMPALPGHITAKIESYDPESETAVLSCGVTAVFPVTEASADLVGRTVIVSRGYYNRRWEIIAAARR